MKKLFLIFLILYFALIPGKILSQQFIEQTGIVLYGTGQGSVDWGDYDNNGYQDILTTGWVEDGYSATIIYRNNGDNTFTEQSAIVLPGVFISSVKWADFDNDNDLDILLTGTTDGETLHAISKIYRNDGGVFNEIAAGLPGIYQSSVAVADYDRDGDIDIIMTGMQTTAERISAIFNNNGNGTFSQLKGTLFTRINNGYASFGDYDNDGYPDVLIAGETATSTRIAELYHNEGDGTFTLNNDGSFTGIAFCAGAWADFDNDGYLDIVLAGENEFPSMISSTKIYMNEGNGQFKEQTGISIGGVKKGAIACGDLDNDGDQDIILSGDRNNAKVSEIYTNNGSWSFSLNNSVTITGTKESSIGLSDYDNDRDLDFILTGMNQSGALVSKVYKNNVAIVNSKPGKPVNLDYEIENTTVRLRWDAVTGDETPPDAISYNLRIGLTPTGSEKMTSQSDINGYRRISAQGNSQLSRRIFYENLRWNITYYASVQAVDNSYIGGDFSLPVSFSITPVQSTNLTGSNISPTSLLLKWIRGNGDRCIVFAKEGTSGPSNPVNNTTYFANTMFGDGSPLGATGWYCIYKGTEDSVVVTGLVPEKDYTIHVIEFQGTSGSEVYATELNPNNDNIDVFSSGIFTTLSGTAMPGTRYSSVAWGDYDNDAFLDIMINGRTISGEDISRVYQNNGDNTFTEKATIVLPGVENGSSAWGDYNNDDLLDIVLTGYNPSLGSISRIYKNNGNDTFSEQTGINLTGVTNSSVAWADYDNDNDLDLLITGEKLGTGPVSKIYRNDGNNIMTEQTGISLTGVKRSSVTFGDYDNDGLPDILICGINTSSNNITKLYRNNGNNTFSEQNGIVLPGIHNGTVAWGDYDNDNRLDILLAGASANIGESSVTHDSKPITKIYHNNGNNTFTELAGSSIMGMDNGSAEWADYNNDGLLDILLIGASGNNFEFKIYINEGIAGFSDLSDLNLPGAIACSSSSADYDNDGDLDILFSGYSGALLSNIYRNNLYMKAGKVKPNARPDAPSGLVATAAPRKLTFSWNGISNDETFFVNMSYNIRCKMANDPTWLVAPQSSSVGFRSVNDLGNAQLNRSFTLMDPVSGKYYWQVQAVDQSYAGSEWSLLDSITVKSTTAYFDSDTVCLGLPTTFTDQSVSVDGIASWSWDFKDGSSSQVQNPVHNYASAGTYPVRLLITSTTGIKDSLIQNVIVKARPKTSFTAPNVCVGLPTTFTNTTLSSGTVVSDWLWNFGDNQTSLAEQPVTHNYSLSGTYQAKLKAVSSNGCADSVTQDVIVAKYPETSLSVAGNFTTVNGNLTSCEGYSLQLTARDDPSYIYQWRKDGNDLTGEENNVYAITGTGTYGARITNTLANCVSVTEQKPVNIKASPPRPNIISDNYTPGVCPGEDPIKLSVDQFVQANNYIWARNEVPIDNSSSSSLEGFLEPGNYTVSAEQNGCTSKSAVFEITSQGVPDKPLLFARGPNVWYIGSNITKAAKFKWYYNGDLIVGAAENYFVANQDLGTYYLRIGNSDGCFISSDKITIPTDDYLPSLKKGEDEDPFAKIKIYPNPSQGILNLEMDNQLSGELSVSIITQSGTEILRIRLEKSTTHFFTEIDLSGQQAGSYFINLKLDKYFSTRQIILQ